MNEDGEEAPVITPPVEAPYLRLSDDEINEDGEEAPVITPSFKPKEVNDLPAVDQTAKDAVDTNADSIPLASRDPTTCVVSIHLLALSEDEMNENNEEELSIANSGRAPRNDM
ncbi:ATP-dependent DNA helicase [Anopheles sinensis]|uniref:ATP-dependent DNA helicase n=1 Tax=Anopheles sinensis TaxID=74873 RepID=A0A084VBW5_ANOSI|nr:ATP-dependent DNA helicase [Anopheles sinensis]